jgi:hypothetical protein
LVIPGNEGSSEKTGFRRIHAVYLKSINYYTFNKESMYVDIFLNK